MPSTRRSNEAGATEENGAGSDSDDSVQVVSAPPNRKDKASPNPTSSSSNSTPAATTRASTRRASSRRSAATAAASGSSNVNATTSTSDSNGPTTRRSRTASIAANPSTSNSKDKSKMAMDQILSPSPHPSPGGSNSKVGIEIDENGKQDQDGGETSMDLLPNKSKSPTKDGQNGKSNENDDDEVEKGLGGGKQDEEEEEDQVEQEPLDPSQIPQQDQDQPMEGVEEENVDSEEEEASDQENGGENGDQSRAEEVEQSALEGDHTVGEMGDDEGDSEESEEDDDEDDDEEDSEEDEDEDEDGERSTSLGAEEKKKGTDKESLANPNSQTLSSDSRASQLQNGTPNSQHASASQGIYSTPMEGIQMTNQASSTDPSSSIPGSTASPLKRNVEGGMMTDGGSASEATGAENAVDENGQPIVKKKKKGKPRPITTPTPPPEPPKPRPTVRLSLKSQVQTATRNDPILAPDSQDLEKFPYLLPIPALAYDKLKSLGNDWADWWATQQRIQADLKEGGTGLAAVTSNGINGTQTNGNAEAGPSNPPASGQASAAQPDGLTPEERAFLLRHQEGPPAKKRRKRRNDVDGQYDVTDPFVDDSELLLDEPTHVGKTATKGFYVCSGDVEVETVKKARKRRADAGVPRGGLAGGDPLDAIDDSPSSTPAHQPHRKVLTEEEIKIRDLERAKALEDEKHIQRTTDLGVRARIDAMKAANSLVVDHVRKFGFTSSMGSSMSGSASHYTYHNNSSPVNRRSPSKAHQTPASSSTSRRESVGTKASPIVLDEDGEEGGGGKKVITQSSVALPSRASTSSNLSLMRDPTPSSSSTPQVSSTGPAPMPVAPGFEIPQWVPSSGIKHPVSPVPLRMVAVYEELRERITREDWSNKGKFPQTMKEPLKDLARLALELGIYDDEHLFNYFPLLFTYNKYTIKKLLKREFFLDHLKYYDTVKETMMEDLKASIQKSLPALKENHAQAVKAYEAGQSGRDALKAEKLKQKEERESRRKLEIQAAVDRKVEFPPDYWNKYPQGKWRDEDCMDEQEMVAVMKREKAGAKDGGPPALRWIWTEEQRYFLTACLALCDAEVEVRNEKADYDSSNVKASQITVRKQLYHTLAECWPAGEGWINSTGVSKEFAVVKRRVDKALPQDFKDKEKEGKEKEKEKTAAANSSAAANTSSKPIA